MFKTLVLTVGLVLLVPVPEGPEPVELFAKEDWYKNQAGKEQDFVGILTKFDRSAPGTGRFNAYRLILDGDKKEMREVYVGNKPDLLAAYVGKKVKFVAKAVEMEVEGRNHREIWAARLFLLDGDAPPKAKRVAILADHKLYGMEPGQEKVFEGALRKTEKGGYYLEMTAGKAVGKEDLVLYGDAGDPLSAYVGKQVRIGGKQVIGAVGMRKFQHTLPGWLELVDVSDVDRGSLQRQIDALRQQLMIEEQRSKDIQAQFAQPLPNPEDAVRLKQRYIVSIQVAEEIKRKIAELEQQQTRPGAGATRKEIEAALEKEKAALNASLTRFKEIQKILANIDNVTPAEFIQAKRDEPKVKAEAERGAERVRELEEQLKRLQQQQPGAALDEITQQIARQQIVIQKIQAEVDVIQKNIAVLGGNPANPEARRLQAMLAETQARLAAEQARLAVLKRDLQRMQQGPQPPDPPEIKPGRVQAPNEEILKQQARVAATKAEFEALKRKLEVVRGQPQQGDIEALEKALKVAQQRLDEELVRLAVLEALQRVEGQKKP
jgi:hypothetical protein